MASLLHGTGGLGIVNFEMFLRWTVYLEDFPCYATECRSKLMQSFSIELSLKLPEAFKGNNTADHIILFDKHPDMSTKIRQFYIFQERHTAKRKTEMIHLFPKLSHATILFWRFLPSSYTFEWYWRHFLAFVDDRTMLHLYQIKGNKCEVKSFFRQNK